MPKIDEIIAGILSGDRRCIARAITIIENHSEEAGKIISAIYPKSGKAHIIGFTGAGGAGKSTLIEKVIREYRHRRKTIGVIAVDPTSPFSGGAFLGDRIRMQELTTDEGVFIRSMASRNYPGGLAKATKDAVRVLDAAGRDVVLVETVGAGQSEVEVVKVAQTIVVIHAPGLGDEIQAIKAGIMEIADIFVVNKADRENANKTVTDIQGMLQMSNVKRAWEPPVLKTIALTGEGVHELVDKLEEHRCYSIDSLQCKSDLLKTRAEEELSEAIGEKTGNMIIEQLRKEGKLDCFLEQILRKETDPSKVAELLLKEKLGRK